MDRWRRPLAWCVPFMRSVALAAPVARMCRHLMACTLRLVRKQLMSTTATLVRRDSARQGRHLQVHLSAVFVTCVRHTVTGYSAIAKFKRALIITTRHAQAT